MHRLLRSLLALTFASSLAACESGLFEDFDGLEAPSWAKRKDSRKKKEPKPKVVAKADPVARDPDGTGWEPISPEAGAPSSTPPTGWEPVGPDGAPPPSPDLPPAPPPPAPGTYQPPVPTARNGGVAVPLPPGHQAAGTSDADPLYGSFLGKEPPALGTDGTWLTRGVSPTLAGMRGQVVFLLFAFQTCPSCAQMTPYLKQWHEMYGPQGLSVVYVNNGRMADEASARAAIAEQGLRFAYLHDKEGSSLSAFAVRSFPTAYVIDRTGKVAWEGTPLAVEAQVQELLLELLARK